jgi:2-polyprenyl-6-methoxyphenol hydroxylase-like FAD-dependent oxidoreductase
MLLKNKTITIVGAGPGGLTLANLLQNKGADVKVYERDFDRKVRIQGTTLDLHKKSGLKAIEAAGLMDAFKESFRNDGDKTRIVDENGNIFFDNHSEDLTTDFDDEWFTPEIDRGSLRNILLDGLTPGTVAWNSHIVSLENQGNIWKIQFENGDTATTNIVIGADGANSKIRPFVTPIKPFYSGVTVLQGNIYNAEKKAENIQALMTGGKIMAMGDSKTITVKADGTAIGEGTLDFALSWKEAESWATDSGVDFQNNKSVCEWFKKEYANWDDIWQELFEYDNTNFVPRPQYCMPLDQHWEAQPNITLIGDAAHLMPPFAGEGVNMAMLDAFELSETLTGKTFTDLKSAIAHYEQKMFTRFAEIGKITLYNTEWMHSPDGLNKMLSFKTKNTVSERKGQP